MTDAYDPENIFAKILRGEIPCDKVAESDHSLAFRDINPSAPTHVLVIPKGPYVTYDHFAASASDAEIVDFTRLISEVIRAEKIDADGFRVISNAGEYGLQEVPHLHVHVVGGRSLGRMLAG